MFLVQLGVLLGFGSIGALIGWANHVPGLTDLAKENPRQTAFMKYREKNGISGRPIWRSYDRIAPELRHAVIVAEDANFNRHGGVDWNAMWDAQKRNLEEGRLYRGGSTITQQLAKNLYLEPSKNVLRKIKEFAIALRLERNLEKKRILEIYLNVVEWGAGIYGAEAAARHYFGKTAAELTIEEASWLAAILPSPLRFEKNRDSDYARERGEWVAGFVKKRMAKD